MRRAHTKPHEQEDKHKYNGQTRRPLPALVERHGPELQKRQSPEARCCRKSNRVPNFPSHIPQLNGTTS